MQSSNLKSQKKVLLLATDCNPNWHSLPALIYEYYRALREKVDVTLVTHVRNQENLAPVLSATDKVDYIDSDRIEKPIHRLSNLLQGDPNKALTLRVALHYPGYIYFEWLVWQKYKDSLIRGEFDLVHRLSPMSPTTGSLIAKRCPVPFIVGPVLGALSWPKEFKEEMHREREWMNYLRSMHRFMPYYMSTYRHASAVLAGYAHTVNDVPEKYREKAIEFSEGGIWPEDFPIVERQQNTKLKILFVGRMVPFKLPELLTRCFVDSKKLQQHQLILVGDGPELTTIKKLVEDHQLERVVDIKGKQSFDNVKRLMYEADIFAFPSIREQGGGVITLASMCQLPSVVVDYGGPSRRVPEGCGIKIPLGNYDELLQRYTETLEQLVENRQQLIHMGKAAREFTQEYYAWDKKADKTLAVYRWVLGETKHKPDYWAN